MTYEPLHHKYRPQTFAELVGQEAIASTITSALQQQKIAPAYLFTGARGTGKTSSARILAKSLNCLRSGAPTETPCGTCEVCRAIASGTALDVIEIDAASNTGVDNIRELIERAQFAPVQCRYKVYVIDECLTGDSLVTTEQGAIRIDNPSILGKKVLSYNEALQRWEFREVLRWLDQGERSTLMIETNQGKIKCTENHLIRTETGWIAAKDIREGIKILSPANVVVKPLFPNLAGTDVSADLLGDTSLTEILSDKKLITLVPSWNKLNRFVHSVLVAAVSNLKFLLSCNRKDMVLAVFSLDGKNIPLKRSTESGSPELNTLLLNLRPYHPPAWGLFTEHSWETVQLSTLTSEVDFQDFVGHTAVISGNGWNIKQNDCQNCAQSLDLSKIRAMVSNPFAVLQRAILNFLKYFKWLNQRENKNESPKIGSAGSLLKDLPGGTSMMAHSASLLKEVHKFNFIRKGTPWRKINSWVIGLHNWATQQTPALTQDLQVASATPILQWEQRLPGNGWQTLSNTLFPQWTTNLARVKSVCLDGVERVYDIEVEGNHNFVANNLLVHNCHMLSTAAFNALLKTLEEPPDRVVFVLATTDPQRVLPTIISRCQRFDFRRIGLEAMGQHLRAIADKEGITITNDAITLVAQIAQGGLRDAESLLDQLSLLPGEVGVEQVWDLVGSVPERDLISLVQAIAQNNPEAVLDYVRHLMDRGREPLIVLQNLAGFYRDLLIAKTAPNRNDLVALTPATWSQLCQFAQHLDTAVILAGQQQLRSSELQLKNTTQPRLWLEVALMGLLPSAISSQPVAREQIGVVPPPSQPVAPATSNKLPQSSIPAEAQPMRPSTSFTAPTDSTSGKEPTFRQAEPEPPQVAPQAEPATASIAETPAPAPISGSSDLRQIWQQIIEHLHPLSKALLNDYGSLVAFDGEHARIGIATEKLVKIAQNQVKNIEKAFLNVFKRTVKVTLEVAPSLNPGSFQSGSSQSASSQSGSSQAEAPPTPNPASPPAQPRNNNAPSIANQANSAPLKPGSKTGKVDRPSTDPTPSSALTSPPPTATPDSQSPSWAEDEATIAAKRLADFFAGKIIDDAEDLASTTTSSVENSLFENASFENASFESKDEALQSEHLTSSEWSESDSDSEDDSSVPF